MTFSQNTAELITTCCFSENESAEIFEGVCLVQDVLKSLVRERWRPGCLDPFQASCVPQDTVEGSQGTTLLVLSGHVLDQEEVDQLKPREVAARLLVWIWK